MLWMWMGAAQLTRARRRPSGEKLCLIVHGSKPGPGLNSTLLSVLNKPLQATSTV